MKKLITSLSFLFCVSIVVSQTITDDYYTPAKKKSFSADRVVTSLSMGTSMSFLNSSKNPSVCTFIAPKIGYQFNNKFQLNIGLLHYNLAGNTFMPLNSGEALYNGKRQNVSGNLIFVEGQYQLNKRWMMSGAVMADANSLNNKQNNYKAISLGMNYKVAEHSYIGISATVESGQGNYFNPNDKTNPYYYGTGNNDMFRSINVGGVGQLGAQVLNGIVR